MDRSNAIGIIELSSIHKGYEVLDRILKSDHVEKLVARSICSGKYIIIVRGELSDVESCVHRAIETGAWAIINTVVISNVDAKIFPAISGATVMEGVNVDGLAVIETFSVASAVKAGDYAVKAADVALPRIHIAMAIGGKGLVVLAGDIEALRFALEPAIEFLKDEGMLAGHSLITQPHPDVIRDLW